MYAVTFSSWLNISNSMTVNTALQYDEYNFKSMKARNQNDSKCVQSNVHYNESVPQYHHHSNSMFLSKVKVMVLPKRVKASPDAVTTPFCC